MALKKRKTTHRRRTRRNPPMAIGLSMRPRSQRTWGKPTRKSSKRSKAAKKAARTRKRNQLALVHAPVTHRRRRKAHTIVKHRGKLTKHARSLAAKKGWRHRKHKKVSFTAQGRKVSFHTKAHKRRRKVLRRVVTKQRPSVSVKRRVLKIHGRRRRRFVTRIVRRNPLVAMKTMLMDGAAIYGGFVGVKIINGLLNTYVLSKISALTTGAMAQFAPVLPAVATFGLAAVAGKFIKQPKLLNALQTGAGLVLIDTIVKKVLLPRLTMLPAPIVAALAGIDDMGFSEYLPSGGRFRPALAEYVGQPGVHPGEAMALDEYVHDSGDHTALSDSEMQGLQSGYAAGSLARPLFSI